MALDNRISLSKLEVYCLVVDLGGVGRAAEHLHVTQPVVSAHLRTLQERLGAPLLYRDGRQLRMTEAGEAAYSWAKELLSRSQEVEREIQGLAEGDAGRAVIASSMTVGSYLLPPILARFYRERPRAQITLRIADPESVLHDTETGAVDLGLLATLERIDAARFDVSRVGGEELVLVAAPDDARVGDSVGVADLASLAFVCSPGGMSRRLIVDRLLADLGVPERRIAIELGHPEAMKSATREGLGVCILFRSSVARELQEGVLREVAIEGAELSVPVLMLARRGKRPTALQAQLIAAIEAGLGAAPQPLDA